MTCRSYGFAGADEDFSALLKADGLPPNVANRLYPAVYQADYKVFRSYGIDGVMSWDMMTTLDRDKGMVKALSAGTPPDLVVQGWQHQLFIANPQTPVVTAILAGNNPTTAIQAGLKAIGVTPVTTTNQGPSQSAVSAYVKNLPAGMSPGSSYTDASGVKYCPDWDDPLAPCVIAAPPTPAAVAAAQAVIDQSSPYWLFPSGDVQANTGSITPVPKPGTSAPLLAPPVAVASTGLNMNKVLMIGGAAALLLMMSKTK